MSDHAIVLHHVPGRMRLRVPAAKGDAARLEQLRSGLALLAGVRQVTANRSIASITIDYDPSLFAEFAGQLQRRAMDLDLAIGGAFGANLSPAESATEKSIERAADAVNRKLQALTGNAINLKEIFPFSIVLYAVLFVDRAINASQWLNWIQFAFSSYVELHESEPVAKLGVGVETLRAEMAAMHLEGLQTVKEQIAGLESAVRALADHVGSPGQEPRGTE